MCVEIEAIRFKLLLGNAPAPAVGLFLVGAYEDQPMSPGRFYDERVLWTFVDDPDADDELAKVKKFRGTVWLVICSNEGEGRHVLSAFARKQDALVFAAQPHNAAACPRSWDGRRTEAVASALTGEEPGKPPACFHADVSQHEIEITELRVDRELQGDAPVWVKIRDSVCVGETFLWAYSTKEAAMASLGRSDLPLPSRDSGEQGDGEMRTLLRAYPVRR
jgi:hypothetical protein